MYIVKLTPTNTVGREVAVKGNSLLFLSPCCEVMVAPYCRAVMADLVWPKNTARAAALSCLPFISSLQWPVHNTRTQDVLEAHCKVQ